MCDDGLWYFVHLYEDEGLESFSTHPGVQQLWIVFLSLPLDLCDYKYSYVYFRLCPVFYEGVVVLWSYMKLYIFD